MEDWDKLDDIPDDTLAVMVRLFEERNFKVKSIVDGRYDQIKKIFPQHLKSQLFKLLMGIDPVK